LKKKPKKDIRESIVFPVFATSSGNENKQSNSVEPTVSCVKDQNAKLSKAKGTRQFIDASKPPSKSSSVSEYESTKNDDDLLNSVIVETVSMVVSKPMQTRNVEEDHSNLRNFKKFKRKGPVMKIPRIVSLEIDYQI